MAQCAFSEGKSQDIGAESVAHQQNFIMKTHCFFWWRSGYTATTLDVATTRLRIFGVAATQFHLVGTSATELQFIDISATKMHQIAH